MYNFLAIEAMIAAKDRDDKALEILEKKKIERTKILYDFKL